MAAKGVESKNIIFQKLQEIYSDAFWENEGKILRIPMEENGARIEIKVQLTAAKNNLGGEQVPSAFQTGETTVGIDNINSKPTAIAQEMDTTSVSNLEMTEKEKENVQKLIESLGL